MFGWILSGNRPGRPAKQLGLILGIFFLLTMLRDAEADMITVTQPFDHQTIQMAAGDTLRIDLEQLGSAGYLWEIETPDATLFDVGEPQTVETPAPSDIVGAPVVRRWLITARKSGIGELRFVHYRPWEGKENASEKLLLKVQIVDNCKGEKE